MDETAPAPWEPDWHCVLCGDSGRREDGPPACSCPDGHPRS